MDDEQPQQPMPLPSGPQPNQPEGHPGNAAPTPPSDPREDAFLAELDRRGVSIVARPNTLLAAEIMTWIGSGAAILLALVLVLGSQLSPATEVPGFDAVGLIGMAVGIVVQSVIQCLGAYYLRRGYSGGRTILTVVGGLNIVYDVVQALSGNLVVLLLAIYIGVVLKLLWDRRATEFFRSERQQREVAAQTNPG